jgi:hypothetical protein
MLKFVNDAKLRAGSILREWKEKREEAKAEKQAKAVMNSEHGHGRFFLLHVPAAATICAAVVEWYWAMLFCVEATGHLAMDWMTSTGSDVAASGAWHFTLDVQSMAVLVGLIAATIPIVMLSMVWLPVQFSMRGSGRWRRGTVIFVGIMANILVIVSGTVVMNHNRQTQVREALAVEQQATQNRGAIQAQIDAVNGDLERLSDRRINNEYAANAANVGADAYRRQYMSPEALARSPVERRDIIVRALGAAERADTLRAERTALIGQLAAAPTQAEVAPNVEDGVGRELNAFARYVEVWRPPFVATICTLIGIFGAWWVLALMQGLNPRDVLRSGWADEGHRIEDLREQEAVAPQPMKPAREVVTDAETGEELMRVRESKPRDYWRKVKKGKPTRVNVDPDIPPDETGVAQDGGGRTAVTLGGEMELAESVDSEDDQRDQAASGNDAPEADAETKADETVIVVVQPEPSEAAIGLQDLSEELPVFEDEPNTDLEPALADLAVETPDQGEQHNDAAEPNQDSEHGEPREEPETDPAKLIAAE